jgi:UDP-N-acetylglucosamine 2-epimerase
VTAAKAGIPLAHVEAGLRSYNRAMPEEVNRVLTDHVSNFLFCPTDTAIENLAKEGITKGIHRVGDVMYDALLHNLVLARKRSRVLDRLGLGQGTYALATVHRAANTDDPERMKSILSALSALSVKVVFPVHPRTQKMIREWGLTVQSNVIMIEPQGYFDILTLQENASGILTDSGGMQKEAYLLGVRCITLREETEWVETVTSGWNKLVGVDRNAIHTAFESWHPQGERLPLYGDGHAADQICSVLFDKLRK